MLYLPLLIAGNGHQLSIPSAILGRELHGIDSDWEWIVDVHSQLRRYLLRASPKKYGRAVMGGISFLRALNLMLEAFYVHVLSVY